MKKHGMIWQPEDLQVQKNKNQDGSIGYLSEPMLPFLHFDFQQFMLTLVEACDAVMLGRLQQDAMSANNEWRS